MEEATEQLKQERQRALELEGLLTASNMSLQTLDKVRLCLRERVQTNGRLLKYVSVLFQLKERISDLEGERDLIKRNYDSLLERYQGPSRPLNRVINQPTSCSQS